MHPERTRWLSLGLCAWTAIAVPAAAEDLDASEAERMLLEPELRPETERASEADALLDEDRHRKLGELSSSLVEVGLHATVQASPIRLLKSVRDVGRSVWDWNDRSPREDEALELLAPAARSGELDPDALALYERLRERQLENNVAELVEEARRSLGRDDFARARPLAGRALELAPHDADVQALVARIERREAEAGAQTLPELGRAEVSPWEVRLSAALLVDDFALAHQLLADDTRDAELARAAARYLEGERGAALADLARLAEGDDAVAATARRWLADRGVNPEHALDREIASYRARRTLGWMGGDELAAAALPATEEALQLSRDGYRAWQGSYKAWRDTLRMVNLIVDAPARAWRAWQPDGSELHAAAKRYLEIAPDGARAAEAAAWLAEVDAQALETARNAPFRDGWLELPHARTPFARRSTTRVVISRVALETHDPVLLEEIGVGEAPAVLLSLDRPGEVAEPAPRALSEGRSLALLARVAAGLETAELEPRGDRERDVLEALRRLDRSVRDGRILRAEPWNPTLAGVGAVGNALVDGGRVRTAAGVAVERDEETVSAERELGRQGGFCPPETACVDRKPAFSRGLYARSDADGDVSVGAAAGFASAQVSLEIGTDGPRASLVLPLARWLGLGRFFPVEARLGVGIEGISAGPNVDDDVEPEDEDER
jgi:hypothetical protein